MFEEQKKVELMKLKKAIEEGEVDERIIYALEKINSKKNFFTLSSCSGRVTLMEVKKFWKKGNVKFYKKWHDKVSVKEIKEALNYKGNKEIWFLVEGTILHIKCKYIEDAIKVVTIARECGLKRSGIFSLKNYPIVELEDDLKLSFPIFIEKLLVDEKYIKTIVKKANYLLQRTWRNLRRFVKQFDEEFY